MFLSVRRKSDKSSMGRVQAALERFFFSRDAMRIYNTSGGQPPPRREGAGMSRESDGERNESELPHVTTSNSDADGAEPTSQQQQAQWQWQSRSADPPTPGRWVCRCG